MGNDMYNEEQLAYAEIVQKETKEALGWWKDRALKAEAKLADKYLIEEQYETACGDRDGLLRMVETLRGQKDRLEADRDAALRAFTELREMWRTRQAKLDAAPPADVPDSCRVDEDGCCFVCGRDVTGCYACSLAAGKPPTDAATEAVREGRVVVPVTRWPDDKDTMSFDGTTFTTVRACVDCSVLICGGPTRCLYCAAKVNEP